MAQAAEKWRLVVHGGAGAMVPGALGSDEERALRDGLKRALEAGARLLAAGHGALDSAEASVRALEDNPLFNAGRGSVFTYQGTIEMDAAVMRGQDRAAGAVNGVSATKNPVSLARTVMEDGRHVFLSREGADEFSRMMDLEQAPPDYFRTPERRRQLEELKARGDDYFDIDVKYGTVGAVALDDQGHVAAATSTGGLTGKRWGRIGDSPVIGAGTFADDRAGAVSATGAGEFFLRIGVALEICSQIRCRSGGAPLPKGEARAILDAVLAEVTSLGGSGGVILVTPWGDGLTSFTTPGMFRGLATPGETKVAIYGEAHESLER
ncbi:MAG: isoaspartyl peptidase/L-asparaginase family protein [Sphingosinicella sp.]